MSNLATTLKYAGLYDLSRKIRNAIVAPGRVLAFIDLERGTNLTTVVIPAASEPDATRTVFGAACLTIRGNE